MNKKAVILLSGGLDSTVCMAVAKDKGCELLPISFNYQQRHRKELEAAKSIAEYYSVKKHLIIETNMSGIGGSALTDEKILVPEGKIENDNVPITYVPARNLIFLSYALAYAEVSEAEEIHIGINALDYSGYPDCRHEFIESFQITANYATRVTAHDKKQIIIKTPLQELTKKEIVILGNKLDAPLHLTTSCYQGFDEACGKCDSCLLRLKGFEEAQINDPIRYCSSVAGVNR